ncbi:MAG: hypothetical protein KBA81_05035 [Rhabdochlamydiaceae bacterium]|nr:hypothetical protein [Rhabdochlamydiaceae bacterium]
MSWQSFEIAVDQTHHTLDGSPVYDARFTSVLKFHDPGLAPVLDLSGAYHINSLGNDAYPHRFLRTFGFYYGKAAVQSPSGWYHILPDGRPLYDHRFAWCGNFQQNYCAVKDFHGRFFHVDQKGGRAYLHSFKYVGDFRDGYAVVLDDAGMSTHIDFNGKPLHGKKFLDLDCFHKGFAKARDEKGWFHIDQQGAPQYSTRYSSIESFYNGVARVEKHDGTLLLINEKGEEINILRGRMDDPFHAVSAELVSFWKFYTLDAACQLKLFDFLPSTTSTLSEKLSLPVSSTEKLLNALAEMQYIECSSSVWCLLNKGELLTKHHPLSLAPAQKLWKDEHLTAWKDLLYSLQTGKSAFENLYKTSWFKYLENEPEKKALYHEALSIYAQHDYKAICSKIDFNNHKTIVDIGGSSGSLLFEILSNYPHLQGILLDLPGVVSLVQIPSALKNRMQLIGADFFDSWPSFKADGALLSRVLHDWSDQKCIELLKKAQSSCPTLYIIENILKNHSGSLLDLNMLVMTEGKERTLQGFQNLFADAGLRLQDTIPLNEVSTIFKTSSVHS